MEIIEYLDKCKSRRLTGKRLHCYFKVQKTALLLRTHSSYQVYKFRGATTNVGPIKRCGEMVVLLMGWHVDAYLYIRDMIEGRFY